MTDHTSDEPTAWPVRPIDKARVARLVLAHLLNDTPLSRSTITDIMVDDYGPSQIESIVIAFTLLAHDLSAAMLQVQPRDDLVARLQQMVATFTLEQESA